MKSLSNQTAPTKNQISNKKPDILKNANVLDAPLCTSFNGGHIRPICFAPIMAGTKAMKYNLQLNLRMLTPKTPTMQKLKLLIETYFVPNSRVWENAEKFTAQRQDDFTNKIQEEPNIGGQRFLWGSVNYLLEPAQCGIVDTTFWRDCWASTYLPRYQQGLTEDVAFRTLPKYSALPLRGFKAIYNDFLRNKMYDAPMEEYKTDQVTEEEWRTFQPKENINEDEEWERNFPRAKRQNSYYTDYRTELLSIDEEFPTLTDENTALSTLAEWQKLVAESRSEAENVEANDWDIIAKIRGSKKLTEGKVQLLGRKVIGINNTAVTQDTYNTNEKISEEFQQLGQQGAYSYTEINVDMFNMIEFKEEGYLHTIVSLHADTVFETAFERQLLNVKAIDKYRPDLKDLKDDILYEIEKCGTRIINETELTKVTGFKRKFTEYFKLPQAIQGDCTTFGYYEDSQNDIMGGTQIGIEPALLESQRSFQFFESDDKETGRFEPKKIWKDYTDILINRNQASQNFVAKVYKNNSPQTANIIDLYVRGQNQMFGLGVHTLICDLPIDESIKKNFTKWGEI